jgi:uroporphyrinogen-III synthase
LFEVGPVVWNANASEFDAVVLTSANAIRHGGAGLSKLTSLPAYCVGEATAEEAQAAGFRVAATGSVDAEALAEAIPGGMRLLHLAGRDHRAIAGAATIIVYDSRTIEPPPSLDLLEGGVAMVHSARAGARLAELVQNPSGIAIAAISERAAGVCGAGWQAIEVAPRPDDPALLALAAELCQNPSR